LRDSFLLQSKSATFWHYWQGQRRAIGKLESGDVLMVARLDRLARSTRDLLNTLAQIADKRAGLANLDSSLSGFSA
jgi:hypothetical protein